VGATPAAAVATISNWGFPVTAPEMAALAHSAGEQTLFYRTGGAPSLALGMARIFARTGGGDAVIGFWYHFAIMFEALFILTIIDAGTRVGRFMLQDLLGPLVPPLGRTSWMPGVVSTSALIVAAWGYFLIQGVRDPLGGINSLWPLFGIANQMLAGVALVLCSVILFKMKRQRYAWVTLLPTVWLLVCTVTAGFQKVFDARPAIGFLAQSRKFAAALADGKVLGPAKSLDQMAQVVFNAKVDLVMTSLFLVVVISMIVFGVLAVRKALASPNVTTHEVIGLADEGQAHARPA